MRSALLALALAAALAAPARAQSPAAVLDPTPPRAVAADAGRLAWLRPAADGRSVLVVRDPGAAPRVVNAALPAGIEHLALGTDAAGRPTVVVSAPDRGKRGNRNSLWAIRVDVPARLRKLPVSRTVRDGMTAPGVRRGVVSFVVRGKGDLDGYAEKTLVIATLTGTRTRRVASLGRGYAGTERESVPAAGGRVLLTADADAPAGEQVVRLRAFGPGRRVRTLVVSRARTANPEGGDNTGASGLGPLVLDAAGRTVTVSRWAAPLEPTFRRAVTGPRDLVTVDVAAGRRTVRPAPGGADVALALGPEGFAVYGADDRQYNSVPRPARAPRGRLRIVAG